MTKKTILVIVAVVCLLSLAFGSYFAYGWWQNKKNLQKEEEKILSEEENNQPESEATVEEQTEDNKTESETATTNEDWQLYKNYQNKFSIKYPKDAKIEDLSDPAVSDIKYSKCLKISTENYYVLIGTTPSEDDPVVCFRSGVGADWSEGPTEKVTAAGVEYTTTGMHTESASAGYYQDFFLISPADGRVKIEYGIDVNEKYGTISKVDAKEIVYKIIASYNPAE